MGFRKIVILTGAGISAESGLSTFRDNNGLWNNHGVEDVATPEAFERDPALVQEFYNARRAQLKEVEPNAAHMALGDLAEHFERKIILVTQNVDNLHERAVEGRALKSDFKLLHMHGELNKARCIVTEEVHDWKDSITHDSACPCCNQKGKLRPHVIWFGEIPLYMGDIMAALKTCDLFVSIGTSGQVRPASDFVHIAKGRALTVKLNYEASQDRGQFDKEIYGPATEVVPQFVQDVLQNKLKRYESSTPKTGFFL